MANPSGAHHLDANHVSSSFNGVNPTNGHGDSGRESSVTALKHNPGISTDWSLEEQKILEDGLKKFSEEQGIIRYAKIALQLQNKTVRDVALRCRWMTKKENSKRRKDNITATKSKERKGVLKWELLEQNAKAFSRISTNLSIMEVHENISLLSQTRDNILKIMNELDDWPDLMRQMPPLPVKLNEELANSILHFK